MSISGLTPGEVLANAAVQETPGSNQELLFKTRVEGVVEGSFTPGGLRNALKSQRFTVTDVPQAVPTAALIERNAIAIRILENKTVYVGGSDLLASTGFPYFYREIFFADVTDDPGVVVWLVCDTGISCQVSILEIA